MITEDEVATRARMGLRVCEVAAALGVSVGHVRNEIAKGHLEAARLGRAVVIPVDSLRVYLERQTAPAIGK
jgi:excisionase family DNA binding protein